MEGRNCIADEHYLPTFFNVSISLHVFIFNIVLFLHLFVNETSLHLQIVDPGGIANWSVTHVDWSERKWHPKLYKAHDITYELLKNITVQFFHEHVYTYIFTDIPIICVCVGSFLMCCCAISTSTANFL